MCTLVCSRRRSSSLLAHGVNLPSHGVASDKTRSVHVTAVKLTLCFVVRRSVFSPPMLEV